MALRNLQVEEMAQVSGKWVDPSNEAGKALRSVPMFAGLLPTLESAHEAIFAVQPRGNARRAEIVTLATSIDSVHDTVARGIHGILTSASLLADEGQAFLTLRDTLLPDGLGVAMQRTYRGQAGYAAILKKRLTPQLSSQLEGVLINQRSLRYYVDRWIEAGERLGELEEEATTLEKQDSPSFAAQVNAARLGWIQTVNVLLSMAELANLSEEQRSTLFASLRDAEANAELRAARRQSGDITEPTDAIAATENATATSPADNPAAVVEPTPPVALQTE